MVHNFCDFMYRFYHLIDKTEVVFQPEEGCFLQTLNTDCRIVAVIVGIIGLIVLVGLV